MHQLKIPNLMQWSWRINWGNSGSPGTLYHTYEVKSQAGVTWGHRGQILIFTKIDTVCLLYIAHL